MFSLLYSCNGLEVSRFHHLWDVNGNSTSLWESFHVLREDKQSCVPEPHCNTHLPPASQDWTDISGGLTCMRRDQSFVLTWKALGAPGEVPGRAHKPNRIRRGLAWPRETIGTVSRKVAMGSASNDSTVGRFPSEQLPKMPPRYLGKRQRVHGAAEGPSALGLLQLLSHL